MKYACHNRPPFAERYIGRDGYWLDGYELHAKAISIPTFGQPSCQFTLTELGQVDKKCDGCKHKEGRKT